MIGYRGIDVVIDTTERVFVRMQGRQLRIDPDASGRATVPASWTEGLRYTADGSPIDGSIWIGKSKQSIRIYKE